MPNTEFKPEPLNRQVSRLWRDNRGNWLLAIGLIVSTLAWLVGYFDLIPVIETVDRPNVRTTLIGGYTLTVEVLGCASDQGKVIVMLYDGEGFNPSSVPIRMASVDINDLQARWQVHNLGYGSYAVYAFQDLDENEIVDPKTERQGVSLSKEPAGNGSAFDYSTAAFEFSPQMKSVAVQLR